MAERSGCRTAGGEADVGRQIPADRPVGFDREVPGESAQVGRARGIFFEDPGSVENPLEIGTC